MVIGCPPAGCPPTGFGFGCDGFGSDRFGVGSDRVGGAVLRGVLPSSPRSRRCSAAILASSCGADAPSQGAGDAVCPTSSSSCSSCAPLPAAVSMGASRSKGGKLHARAIYASGEMSREGFQGRPAFRFRSQPGKHYLTKLFHYTQAEIAIIYLYIDTVGKATGQGRAAAKDEGFSSISPVSSRCLAICSRWILIFKGIDPSPDRGCKTSPERISYGTQTAS